MREKRSKTILNFYGLVKDKILKDKNLKFDMAAILKTQIHAQKVFLEKFEI